MDRAGSSSTRLAPQPQRHAPIVLGTAGNVDQLSCCRYDLGMTNLGRIDGRDAALPTLGQRSTPSRPMLMSAYDQIEDIGQE